MQGIRHSLCFNGFLIFYFLLSQTYTTIDSLSGNVKLSTLLSVVRLFVIGIGMS